MSTPANDHAASGGVEGGEDHYRLLVRSITDYAIYMLDSNGRIISWNGGAERFMGYKADEIVGHHFSRFYTDQDRAAGLPQIALRTTATKGKFEAEGLRVRKDGSTFWAHVVIEPIRDMEGKLVGFAKITRDLGKRSTAEAKLRSSEDQFKLLVQGVTDYAIYMLDLNGHVASWNAGAQRIKGYTPGDIIGEHFSRFYTDDDRANGEPERALETAKREGRFAKEGWRVRKDGERFWASVVIDPIHNDDGVLIGFAKVTRDLTERQEAQHEIEKARETLVQAQKMDAIGQLTGGVAHDFNNLLMATLSSLELLRKRLGDDQKAIKLLDNAVEGAQRGATLTRRMLAFARRQELQLTAVDIPDLVRGMTHLIERSLGPSIAIETRFPLRLEAVNADFNQLEMALLNLVVNARDAMSEGGTITIAAANKLPTPAELGDMAPGKYVVLSVTDTGSGMDAETLSRAMEPFFTTKGVGKGTGLGLSMVHGIAEQSGGRLKLQSVVGRGTTVEVWLPAAELQQAEVVEVEKPEDQPIFRPLTVLAVDDDELVLMNTVALLEDLGHIVFEAHSGAEALEIFRREPGIDLIITDQAMPQMTGIQFAQSALAERAEVPIILATGYGELPADAPSSLQKLPKPYGLADLTRAVSTATSQHSLGV
jgi:PAS domain S-box-containing protein